MKTVNEILEMIEELEYAAVQAVVSGCPLNRLNTAKEALKAAIEELHRDARRYKWLKSQKSLSLNSDGSLWKRDGVEFRASHCMASGGTQWGAYETLDQLIDAAMEST